MQMVESFNDTASTVNMITSTDINQIEDLTDQTIFESKVQAPQGGWSQPRISEKHTFEVTLPAHSYRIFKLIKE